MKKSIIPAICALLVGGVAITVSKDRQPPAGEFRAGAAAIDITPPKFPVRVNGMFTERVANSAADPLYAKAIALDDGTSQLVLCVVDTCMMPRDLIDRAKLIVAKQTGLSSEHMTVSATHTHSAPSAMGCLGSRMDPDYVAWLPGKLAAAMLAALENLQPARIGWASVDDWQNTHNRRWIQRADSVGTDPFGGRTVRANMHPGHLSHKVIGPSGPVDPELSVLAVQTRGGKALALLANYSQHYFGSPLLSADYYGAFSKHITAQLSAAPGGQPFVAMMSQGTSGDLMWMDYGAPRTARQLDTYSADVAKNVLAAYQKIAWQESVPLGVVEKQITLRYRVPDEERLAWARERVAALGNRLPSSQQDIYAKESVVLHERQTAELKLQAIRIGELGITTLPNEVYSITGLQLKAQTPFAAHFNLALANGSSGYIPPPAQHQLGGYSTWPARTAGLEVQAEPIIVETLLGALEEVSGKNRRPLTDTHGAYAKAIIASQPIGYWRLNELAGNVAHNAIAGGPDAQLSGRIAHYLPGVASGSGCGEQAALRASNFSGPRQINRSLHFVEGHLDAVLPELGDQSSVAFWFWLGEASGASQRDGTLVKLPSGAELHAWQGADHRVTFSPAAEKSWAADDWHFAVLVRDGDHVRISVDGQAEPDINIANAQPAEESTVRFGEGLEGKLDEIAVFDRALSSAEIASYWRASGIAERRAEAIAARERAEKLAAERAKPPAFAASYPAAIDALKPAIHARLADVPEGLTVERGVHISPGTVAAFKSGRIRGEHAPLGAAYSVSLWFKNDLANLARPVTAYLFSRGPEGDRLAPGDHLGIGGSHLAGVTGKLIVFNGNAEDDIAAGTTLIPPGTWNHVVLIRDGGRVTVYLNGATKPEFAAELKPTSGDSKQFFIGARSDRFAPLVGNLAEFALFDRALTSNEAQRLYKSSGLAK